MNRGARSCRAGISAVGALALGLLVVANSNAAAQAGGDSLEVRRVAGSSTEVVVAVPDAAAGRTLPADSFSAHLGNRAAPLEVRRLADRTLDLSIVVDVGVDSARSDLAQSDAIRGALVELVLRLSPGTRISVAGGAFGVDRQATLAAVAQVHATSSARTDQLDAVLSRTTPPDRRHAVVVVTDRVRADRVRTTELHPDERTVVDLISVGAGTGTGGPLATAATASGGMSVRAKDPAGVLAATDAIARDLARLYLVGVDPITLSTPGAELSVTTATDRWSTPLGSHTSRAVNEEVRPPVSETRVAPSRSADSVSTALILGIATLLSLAVLAFLVRSVGAWALHVLRAHERNRQELRDAR